MNEVYTTLKQVTEDILTNMRRSGGNLLAGYFLGFLDEDDHYDYTLEDINSGQCMMWARRAMDALGGPSPDCLCVWIDDGEELSEFEFSHVVLFYKGKYYDCETLNGVERPIDIPYFKNLGGAEEHLFLTFLPEKRFWPDSELQEEV